MAFSLVFSYLIDELNDDEVIAVLAHEIGHYRKHHGVVSMIIEAVSALMMFFLMSLFIGSDDLARALGGSEQSDLTSPGGLLGILTPHPSPPCY